MGTLFMCNLRVIDMKTLYNFGVIAHNMTTLYMCVIWENEDFNMTTLCMCVIWENKNFNMTTLCICEITTLCICVIWINNV